MRKGKIDLDLSGKGDTVKSDENYSHRRHQTHLGRNLCWTGQTHEDCGKQKYPLCSGAHFSYAKCCYILYACSIPARSGGSVIIDSIHTYHTDNKISIYHSWQTMWEGINRGKRGQLQIFPVGLSHVWSKQLGFRETAWRCTQPDPDLHDGLEYY